MPLQIRAHHGPAKPRAITHGHVGILNTEDAFLDQIENLAVERCLQPVPYVAWDGLVQPDWLLPNRRIESHRTLNCSLGGFCPADYLNQRHHVRRIKGMS